ncbi:predicted protein [Chaetomium globosum CBS 148.51]|uniref:Uncharacterized protein n=1 Tax=Chaetomium globosum (strain ATCC 6205 / CBS 148.51 / DSM 1962 / NBRC 6347 / NRRL 1970) TaxID=306901 RepID=Q2H221_CHAGB|nr:uncharacterized protein CHGG_04175 [Chaetomium globosum CBS 148.51]EAQ87556.1 predicted protein [Chaetomium globosum CBS 148.51]
MNGRNSQPAREEASGGHPSAAPDGRHRPERSSTWSRPSPTSCRAPAATCSVRRPPASALPCACSGGVLDRLFFPRQGGAAAGVGGGSGVVAGPVSGTCSAAAVAGASALGLGARGGFVSGVAGDGDAYAGSGGRGPVSSGVVGLGSSGWDAGSVDGDSIGDDSTAVASSEHGFANRRWDGRC